MSVLKLVQFLNAASLILSSPFGSLMLVRALQPLNEPLFMLVIEFESVTVFKDVQP